MGLPKTILAEDEYLAFERAAEERHVYIDGGIFAMAGESGAHSDIITKSAYTLVHQLGDGPCRVRIKDTKVRSGPISKSSRRPAGLYSYPDIVVICGEPEYLDDFQDVILNPKVIVETLSESTEAFDRGDKLRRYQKYNQSLTDYILVSQHRPQIEHFHREKDGTSRYSIHEGLEAIVRIDSIKCQLKAADVYKRIEFAGESDE